MVIILFLVAQEKHRDVLVTTGHVRLFLTYTDDICLSKDAEHYKL